MRGDDVGTVFLPMEQRVSARAHWIAHTLRGRGTLVLDEGARRAVLEGGRSLLPSGVVEVRGTFRRGDPVDLVTADSAPFARGLSAFSSAELHVIRGRNSREVGDLLGAPHGDEVIHRDDLVVI